MDESDYDGLFPPDSVTWRVHGDPLLWVAGLRALLLQAVHPAAMAGVLQHSDFRADPWVGCSGPLGTSGPWASAPAKKSRRPALGSAVCTTASPARTPSPA